MEAARTSALLQRTLRLTSHSIERSEPYSMYALVFLVVGLIAGALNLARVSAVAVQISWILFFIGIVLVAIHIITGRTARVA
jgi:uncharacterized membrane protein YtjA (UPF0391 family)